MNVPNLAERLVVTPILDQEKQVNAASIDLRLGSAFMEIRRREAHVIDPFAEAPVKSAAAPERWDIPFGESFVLHPGQFILGSTFEFIRLPNHIGGQVLGRSSWGRVGLIVATAVTVQPGFGGCLTLEIQNLGSIPIKLYPGLRVAQLMLWTTEEPTKKPYSKAAKYDAPLGPESSRIGWENEEVDRLKGIGRRLQGGALTPPATPPGPPAPPAGPTTPVTTPPPATPPAAPTAPAPPTPPPSAPPVAPTSSPAPPPAAPTPPSATSPPSAAQSPLRRRLWNRK